MKLNILVIFLISFASQAVQLKQVVTDLEQPVDVKFFPNSSVELLVAGKTGQLTFANLLTNDKYVVHEFAVKSSSEMGLLGLAFHPDFSMDSNLGANNKISNNFIFVNYFPHDGRRKTRVSRFTLTKKNSHYNLSNEKVIIEINQPYGNHNGGQIAFGSDHYLYIGMGDGGSGGDPLGHGQNTQTLLGNMLRIDINTSDDVAYAIPKDNPFVKQSNFKPEIWAYGLRNPWRFSFHKGVLIVADVGQNKFEEVSVVEKGQNLGWNTMEATHCFSPRINCDTANLTLPKLEYGRDKGQSITGGFVYNGTLNSDLKSHYIYGDFMSGNIWSVKYPSFLSPKKIMSKQGYLSTFALDTAGEIYVTEYSKGIIYQLVP